MDIRRPSARSRACVSFDDVFSFIFVTYLESDIVKPERLRAMKGTENLLEHEAFRMSKWHRNDRDRLGASELIEGIPYTQRISMLSG
jgi:hypothetical protein